MAAAGSPSRTEASAAVEPVGWRYVLGALCVSVPAGSLAEAARIGVAAVSACGDDADGHLRVDLRPDRVELSLLDRTGDRATWRDTELAHTVSATLQEVGVAVAGSVTGPGNPRPVQTLELAIDTMDRTMIMPFWKAVLGYVDAPGSFDIGSSEPADAICDPAGQLPTVWFQQMDKSRPQRNRIHFDIAVAHDEADGRIAAALAAGGRLLSDAEARAFWVLADPEGNEVCVCTWQDRDQQPA